MFKVIPLFKVAPFHASDHKCNFDVKVNDGFFFDKCEIG